MNIPEKYRHDVDIATDLLKSEGCESIYLFGSLVTGNMHEKSDLDIGITGLPPAKFFSVYSKLYQKLDVSIDLVDFDKKKDFFSLLNDLGEVIKIG